MEPKDNRNRNSEAAAGLRVLGFLLLPLVLFPLLSLVTYDPQDISWLASPPNNPSSNFIGIVGAWSTFAGYMILGLGTWLLPVWMIVFAVLLARGRPRRFGPRLAWCGLITVMICSLLQLDNGLFSGVLARLNADPNAGGAIGYVLMTLFLERLLSPVGGAIVASLVLVFAAVMAVGPAVLAATGRDLLDGWRERRLRHADQAERLAVEERRLARQLEAERRRAEREAARQARELANEQRRQAREAEQRRRTAEAEARQRAFEDRKQQLAADREREAAKAAASRQTAADAAAAARREREQAAPAHVAAIPPAEESAPQASAAGQAPAAAPPQPPAPPYKLPGVDLLDPIPGGEAVHGDVDQKAHVLVKTLAEFGIAVEVTHVELGPVVTSFELLPAPGIRVEKIANMAKNLEMALKATSVRVEAPIPGKGVVGVETPNDKARPVTVREMLESTRWAEATRKMEIPVLLGKDVGGKDLVVDLATVPHMLIAGATGSGKSVCINALLSGLLMSRTPEELRLMLVDPKIVEFAIYNELPHLVVPVITDPKKVSLGLRWAIHEMEKRYKLLHAAGVRNIAAYNRRDLATQPDMFGEAPSGESSLPRKLPYIVIVIDELADLMLQAGPEIENSIARLAQLSRAVGIHLVLATQRPSVNVITGTIKANFPGRVAFQVAQKVDSRTILDHMGAETLIGRGDMLYLDPRTSKLVRAQGAFISDNDTKRVVEFIRKQARPVYIQEVQERLARAVEEDDGGDGEGGEAAAVPEGAGEDGDELFDQAVQVIRETRRASTSSLQRRLRIGYTRAARLMDLMEERGIVGPPKGSDPREILIDLDGDIPNNGPSDDAAGPDAVPERETAQ